MKIIPPYQIASEILNLINEAKEYLILVSPYVNFNNWDRIKIDIENALKRNVKIQFYTRLDSENFKSWEQIEALGIKPKLIKNLHSKLYFNENSGIVTSMNLLTSSNLNAIEFGAIYNTEEELKELKEFVKKYLEPNLEKEKPNDEDLYLAKEKFQIVLQNYLSNCLEQNVTSRWNNGCLTLNLNNQYNLSLDKVRNNFQIYGIISRIEHDNFRKFLDNSSLTNVNLSLNSSSIDAISKKTYTTNNFDFLTVTEKKEIMDIALKFIIELTKFKSYCYINRKAIC